MSFRHTAEEALGRAKAQLAAKTESGARYAALELRLALEAIAYDFAQTFREELPESGYEKWQPPALVATLLELDPDADRSSSLAVRREDGAGDAPFKSLGEDRRTPLKALKKFYHTLGSLLHIPTLAQVRAGRAFDAAKARDRCATVVEELEQVLASPIRDIRFRNLARVECKRCEQPIIRHVPDGSDGLVAKCRSCGAGHDIRSLPGGKVEYLARGPDVTCPKCKHPAFLFEDELEPGKWWTCQGCGAKPMIQLCLTLQEEERA